MRWLREILTTIVGLIILLTPCILLFYAGITYRESQQLENNGAITNGIIIWRSTPCQSRRHTFMVSYEYAVSKLSGEQEYTTEDEAVYNCDLYDDFAVGTAVKVRYLPTQPNESLLVGNRLNHTDLLFGGIFIGILLLLGAGIPMVKEYIAIRKQVR